jgi:hypothetical protein
VDAADVVRRSSCPVVLDVDITTTRAWTLRRESLGSRPDDFLAAIREVVGDAARDGHGVEPERSSGTDRPTTADRPLRPAAVQG